MKKVEKTWGYEIWFENNEKYCGKELFVRSGEWSSKGKYHYHLIKDETFYIISGILVLDYEDKHDELQSILLYQRDTFRVPPGMKHRFSSQTLGGCKFIEVSTKHMDEDSYRCFRNDEGEWVAA
jgi:mannose-6-phosphate isomerase-like protein (cupin superfamily)